MSVYWSKYLWSYSCSLIWQFSWDSYVKQPSKESEKMSANNLRQQTNECKPLFEKLFFCSELTVLSRQNVVIAPFNAFYFILCCIILIKFALWLQEWMARLWMPEPIFLKTADLLGFPCTKTAWFHESGSCADKNA